MKMENIFATIFYFREKTKKIMKKWDRKDSKKVVEYLCLKSDSVP